MKNKIEFRGKSYDVLDSRIDGNVILYKIKYRKVDTWVNDPDECLLIAPLSEDDENGVIAKRLSTDSPVWNINRYWLHGSLGQNLGRYNSKNQDFLFVPETDVRRLKSLAAQLI